MAHELEKAQYADDARWMAEPWTAWEYKSITNDDYQRFGCAPIWDPRILYRRRPDAPTKCCRLCKHRIETAITADRRCQLNHEYCNCDQCLNYEPFPVWCPIDAEAKQEQEPCKCSTCRHTYEPKPRTIRIDAELPEPVRVVSFDRELDNDNARITIQLDNRQDARAWYDILAIKIAMKEG